MQSYRTRSNYALNHYTVLGLLKPRSTNTTISKDDLKAAYHRALLLNHPDKIPKVDGKWSSNPINSPTFSFYSVDEIVHAYQTLADDKLKAAYDRQLLSSRIRIDLLQEEASKNSTHLGVETYDLEDLVYNEVKEGWFMSCRCGHDEGFTVTEIDLEAESSEGQIYIGCRGCSLFIKVLFELAEEDVAQR